MTATSTLARPRPAMPSTDGRTLGARLRRIAVGATEQPAWVRPAFLGLLVATAALYLWRLSDSGYANSFYAAAVQAGSQSWKALLFGSLDAGNAITVDKPPASMWVMGLSARIFGFSSWSLLVPQALAGVGSVALLYAAVRRRFGPAAGLLAGGVLALTPVAALMFRYDQPDALLVLLLVAGGYATLRAIEHASPRWLALAGAALGFAFLTKMLQGLLVLPAFALAYLIAAPVSLPRRIGHLLAGGAALVVSAGWYVALVAVWPAASRPYIGGSTNDSLVELAVGYNGLGRIFGGGGGAGGGGNPGGNNSVGFGGTAGLGRLFGASMGTEISWLLPAALIALLAGLWFTRRAARTDLTRAALVVWGGWLVVTGVVFSYMGGIVHPYYTVALAPAIGALVGIGANQLWQGRDSTAARALLATMTLVTGVWCFGLLARTPTWVPWLRWVVLIGTAVAAAGLLPRREQIGRAAPAVAGFALVTTLAATGAYTLVTASATHQGSIPLSGPVTGSGGGPGGGQGLGQAAGGGASGQGSAAIGRSTSDGASLDDLLRATTTTWAAAISGASSAADLELSSGKAVIALGGWDGSDPSPTLAEFQQYVASGQIHYLISSGRGGGGPGGQGGGASSSSEIATWVAAHYTASTVDATTVYDLTQPAT